MRVTFLQLLTILLAPYKFCASSSDNNYTDYCKRNEERCDKDGLYKYMALTSFEDFAIKDILDKDVELIQLRPMIALKATESTLSIYPNR